jgi:predicted permease
MDGLRRDLQTGLRRLRRDRAFSLTAGLTLALCLGANTALFSVVHHVLLRPLPVPEPDRIVLMANEYPGAGAVGGSNSGVPDYFDRLRETSVLEAQSLVNQGSASLSEDGLPVRVRLMNVTPSFFSLVRVQPVLGRPFTPEEGEVGADDVVVLSDSLWRRHFGADPGAVGQELRLDGEPHTVVGVMPPSFEAFSPGVLMWRPLAFTPEQRSDEARHSNNHRNLGRLKPGATLEQAQAQIDALNAANLERFPQYRDVLLNAGFHTVVIPLGEHLVRHVKPTLYLLWGGAFFVLLIGCVNVANLVLVRARVRLKELATRLALGASRGQIARQLVVESLALASGAGLAGLGVAAAALRAVGGFELEGLPHGTAIRLDGVAVLYALGLCAVIGVAMGLVPVLIALPDSLASTLREEGRGASGGRGARVLRRGLVVAQVAFTFVLLVGAGLLLASFRQVLEVDPGFSPEGVATGSVVLPGSRYPDDDARRRFTGEALRRVRALPGVTAAGATDTIPFGFVDNDSVIFAEGYEMKPGESVVSPDRVRVTPGYFEAIGARLVRGRFFREGDDADGRPVVIVDQRLARRFWPDADPIGRRMYQPTSIDDLTAITDDTVFHTVVGVVGDVKLHDLTEGEEAIGTYFFPVAQETSGLLSFAVRTGGSADAVPAALRAALAELDAEMPLFDVQRLEDRAAAALASQRAPALLSASFGGLALLLSAVGIYGVLAYLVAQRRREIGIRLALGSPARRIFELVVREGLWLVGTGFAAGAIGAAALRGSLESQLFRVEAGDPAVVGSVALVLAAVAVTACTVPALRAARIDPVVALDDDR